MHQSINSMVQTAVSQVQPFWTSRALSSMRFPISRRLPVERYAIKMMGTTISLAGSPRIKAMRMTPSMPNRRAKGSKKEVQCGQDRDTADLHIGQQPDKQPRRRGDGRRPPQDEQRPVKDGADDDLAHLRPAVGRQLQRKGRGNAL